MIACLSEIAKNQKFQKTSLHAVELLKDTIPRIIPISNTLSKESENGVVRSANGLNDQFVKFWFPVLFAFHNIIMNGEDLEVRSRALNYLFDSLVEYGDRFDPEFWNTVCSQLLFPIFVVLKSRSEMARFNSKDDMSVWLSTTMIQALRNLIALLTHYFATLEHMLDGFLDLLVTCIDQENETVSRVGASCLLQLVEQNVEKLEPKHWTLIVDKIVYLFEITTANELFEVNLSRAENDEQDIVNNADAASNGNAIKDGKDGSTIPASGASSVISTGSEDSKSSNIQLQQPNSQRKSSFLDQNHSRQKIFRKTIVKCILQLLMIDTVKELLEKRETSADGTTVVVGSEVYHHFPIDQLLRITQKLRSSYQFSHKFNNDRELRMNLWRQGFMKQMPNLLRQMSTSASTYIAIMMRLISDNSKLGDDNASSILSLLIPFIVEILSVYNKVEPNDTRNINTWSPVVVDILDGYNELPADDFSRNLDVLYPALVDILNKDVIGQVRISLQTVFRRIGDNILKGKGKSKAY